MTMRKEEIESQEEKDIKQRIEAVKDTISGLEDSIIQLEAELRAARRKRRGC